jgi:hypothetical protein
MANPNTPYGLRPYAYMSGAPYNGAVRTYYVPVGNATALYFGDPLVLISNSSDGNGIPAVEIATAGEGATNYVIGCFQGRSNNAGQATITVTQDQHPYLPAATAGYIYVCDDPFLLYAIQEDSVGGAMASGASGGNASLVAGAGSTFDSQSGWLLDSSTLSHAGGGTDPDQQLRIIQLLQQQDNAVGNFAKWLVKINDGIHPFTNPNSI